MKSIIRHWPGDTGHPGYGAMRCGLVREPERIPEHVFHSWTLDFDELTCEECRREVERSAREYEAELMRRKAVGESLFS